MTQANSSLKGLYQDLCECPKDGYEEYLNSDFASIHCPRTAASNINDHIWAKLVNRLDGVAGVKPKFDPLNGLRFMRVESKPRSILLWLKRVDQGRHHKSFPTPHAQDMAETGQIEMFQSDEILVLGYSRTLDHTGISRVSINPPSLTNKPSWWIDLVPIASTSIARTTGKLEYRIEMSEQKRLKR